MPQLQHVGKHAPLSLLTPYVKISSYWALQVSSSQCEVCIGLYTLSSRWGICMGCHIMKGVTEQCMARLRLTSPEHFTFYFTFSIPIVSIPLLNAVLPACSCIPFITQERISVFRYNTDVHNNYFSLTIPASHDTWVLVTLIYKGPNEGDGIIIYHDATNKGNKTTMSSSSPGTAPGIIKIGKMFDEPGNA